MGRIAKASGHPAAGEDLEIEAPVRRPVAVLVSHEQLRAVAWAFARAAGGLRLGYVQSSPGTTPSGASPATADLALLREHGLLCGHPIVGAGAAGHVSASTVGALHVGLCSAGWDAAVCGPAPRGAEHGAGTAAGADEDRPTSRLAALDPCHAALSLGCPTLLVADMSLGRGRGGPISAATLTLLDLLLEPVTVALPAGMRSPVGADLRAGLGPVYDGVRPGPAQQVRRPARIARHDWRRAEIDLPGFAASPVAPPEAGRPTARRPLLHAAALAAGTTLAELAAACRADPQPSPEETIALVADGEDPARSADSSPAAGSRAAARATGA